MLKYNLSRLCILIFAVLWSSTFYSQSSKTNASLRFALATNQFKQSELNVLVQGNIPELLKQQKELHFIFHYSSGDIASISCSSQTLEHLFESKTIDYAELPSSRKQLMNDTMIYRNRIRAAKVWTAPLPQAYNGKGIVMGIIDSGTDFSHPDFKDSTGTTRIKSMWDQRYASGSTVPLPFNYGIEWSESQINNNQCTHTDFQYYGHGTHVTGIAAGNGKANGRNEGVASKSDLVIVALDFTKVGPTIADGVNYILNKAAALGKPCVINASVGDYYGSHDATDLEAKLIENLIKNKPGVVLVAAAGNGGGKRFHAKTLVNTNDTFFTWIKNASILDYTCYGDTIQFKQLQFRVGANRTNFSNLGTSVFRNPLQALNTIITDTIKHNNQRIGILKSTLSINAYGVCEWALQINADTNALFWRIETTGKGEHQAWNFDLVAANLPNSTQYPNITRYTYPDTLSTIVSGFQCSNEIITVGNYVNLSQYYDVNNIIRTISSVGGNLSGSSSRGPTRTGAIKPDITATGEAVFSCLAIGLKAGLIANTPSVVAYGGMHVLGGGTSASCPVVAGLAALYLQRYPQATNREIKEAIQFCAYKDGFTGTNLPNNSWGYGKLDGKASLYCKEGVFNNVLETDLTRHIKIFPNPFTTHFTIELNQHFNGIVRLYDAKGNFLFEQNLNGNVIDVSGFENLNDYHGLLFIILTDQKQSFSAKLIKE